MSETKIRKINLLPGASRLQVKALRYRGKNKMLTILVLILWVVSVGLVFGVYLISGARVKAAEDALAKKKQEASKYSNVTLATSRVRTLAKQVGDVLATRFEYSQVFKNFAKLYDSSIKVDSFELKGQTSFVVQGSMPNYEVAKALEQMVKDLNAKKYDGFKSSRLESFSWNPKDGWSFTMTVGI